MSKINILQVIPNPQGTPYILDDKLRLWRDVGFGRSGEAIEWNLVELPEEPNEPA